MTTARLPPDPGLAVGGGGGGGAAVAVVSAAGGPLKLALPLVRVREKESGGVAENVYKSARTACGWVVGSEDVNSDELIRVPAHSAHTGGGKSSAAPDALETPGPSPSMGTRT